MARAPIIDFMTALSKPVTLGKYLVSPLVRRTDEGRFAPSVSIRSGRGSGTHDRVLRFTELFTSAADALHYAAEQGRHWVVHPQAR